jgi:hypothetical protein
VLELGAGGTGLPSIVASRCGASIVVATDGNDGVVLDLLRQNIELNSCYCCSDHPYTAPLPPTPHQPTPHDSTLPKLSCRQLLWGHRGHVHELRIEVRKHIKNSHLHIQHHRRPTFDYIIAADVVQWPAVLEPLLHTVTAFMWLERDEDDNDEDNSDDQTESAGNRDTHITPLPVFILGIVERSSTIYEQFLSLAQTMGFTYRLIDYSEYLTNGIVPVSCQEYGGRVTKLLELSLRPSVLYGAKPLLLRVLSSSKQEGPSNDDTGSSEDESYVNYTVGKSYQHTTFLPC